MVDIIHKLNQHLITQIWQLAQNRVFFKNKWHYILLKLSAKN